MVYHELNPLTGQIIQSKTRAELGGPFQPIADRRGARNYWSSSLYSQAEEYHTDGTRTVHSWDVDGYFDPLYPNADASFFRSFQGLISGIDAQGNFGMSVTHDRLSAYASYGLTLPMYCQAQSAGGLGPQLPIFNSTVATDFNGNPLELMSNGLMAPDDSTGDLYMIGRSRQLGFNTSPDHHLARGGTSLAFNVPLGDYTTPHSLNEHGVILIGSDDTAWVMQCRSQATGEVINTWKAPTIGNATFKPGIAVDHIHNRAGRALLYEPFKLHENDEDAAKEKGNWMERGGYRQDSHR